MRAWAALGALAMMLAACTSPEAARVRGGARGADVGNTGPAVVMHEGSHPYHGTPRLIPVDAPLEPAQQAAGASRP